jgi:hypothetical protein
MGDWPRIIREVLGMIRKGWSPAVRFAMPGFLVGMACCWALGSGHPPVARAQAAVPAEASGTLAFTSFEPGSSTQWLYVVDTRTQAFAVYRVDPRNPKGAVKLEAARQYRWDLKLAEYNNQPPEVAAVESMVGHTTKK